MLALAQHQPIEFDAFVEVASGWGSILAATPPNRVQME